MASGSQSTVLPEHSRAPPHTGTARHCLQVVPQDRFSLSPPTSPLSPPWVLAFWGMKTHALGWGRGMPSYLSPQGWALFKTRDFHHLKAVQLACERYEGRGGGREGETVSPCRSRGAVAPALRARPQLADRGTAGRYTSQGFLPPRTKCSWTLTG